MISNPTHPSSLEQGRNKIDMPCKWGQLFVSFMGPWVVVGGQIIIMQFRRIFGLLDC